MPANSGIAQAAGGTGALAPRVLFVDHSADPGGGQLGLLRFLQQAPPESIRPEVALLSGGKLRADFSDAAPSTFVLDEDAFSFRKTPLYAYRLRRLIVGRGYDLIVINSLYAAAVYALLNRCGLARHTGSSYYSRVSMESLTGTKRLVGIRGIFPVFDAFLANSEWTASCIPASLGKQRYVAYPVSGIHAPARSRGTDPCSSDTIRIVTLSRPDRWKGLDLLVRAVADLAERYPAKSISVDLYGGDFFSDAEYLAELDTLVATSPVKVTRRGHIDDVSTVLSNSDIFVLPTMQPEPFGQSVAQALAAGCVVIVPDEGGPLEMVRPRETGLVFRARDDASLRDQIVTAVDDPLLSRRLSHAAMASTEQFEDSATVQMLLTAVQDMLGSADAEQRLCGRGSSED